MAMDRVKRALESVALAMAEGDRKYGENAWIPKTDSRDWGTNVLDHTAGAGRHVERRLRGELIDESGLPALAHVGARALIALQIEIEQFDIPYLDAEVKAPTMEIDQALLLQVAGFLKVASMGLPVTKKEAGELLNKIGDAFPAVP